MKINYKINQKFNFLPLLAIGILLCPNATKAQLNPLNAQYFLNQYLANPAFAGQNKGLNLNLNYRKLSTNIPGSPSTQALTADYKIKKVGLGLNLHNEKAGSLQRTKIMATYAYHIALNDGKKKLHFGVSAGLFDEQVDLNNFNGDITDPELSQFNSKEAQFDGDIGIAYTSKTINLEASLPNIRSFIRKGQNYNVNRSVFYSAISYKFNSSNTTNALEIEPKVAFRGFRDYDNILDAGANFIFMGKVFATAMYHSTKNASFGAGINYKTSLTIMAFYTTQPSFLQTSANGSFEISLKANLFK